MNDSQDPASRPPSNPTEASPQAAPSSPPIPAAVQHRQPTPTPDDPTPPGVASRQDGGERKGCLRRFFGGIWTFIDTSRRVVVNALFVLLVAFVLLALLADDTALVPDPGVLVLAPEGDIVEQLDGDALDRAVGDLVGDTAPQTLLRDLTDAVLAAADDERIQILLLDLNGMSSGGLSKLQTLGRAVERFRAQGKRVIATADNYTQSTYYLASTADEVHLHDMGLVLIPGYGRYRTYYKDGLDRLEVAVNVFRVGEFKSAVEPFLRNDMSAEAKEANLEWLGDLWRSYLADVAPRRGLEADDLEARLDRFVEVLRAHEGDTARAAQEMGLVDHLGGRDAVNDRLRELLELEDDEEIPTLEHLDYLATLGERASRSAGDRRVAVIVARGSIVDGEAPPGQIGGDTVARLIREAREDESVAALVLRVDSGGGSAFASEVIRRQFELARRDGLPVVVSMGTVAASGGYWISTASDEIWASPTTITGSIGIFGLFPTIEKPLEKHLGMRVDGVGTTPLAGALRMDRALAPEAGQAIQLMIEQGYREFLERVGEARNMTPETVDRIARGRVWSGEDALDLGLVDHMGGLDDAVASAAERAQLGDDYGVWLVEPELDFSDQLMVDLLTRVAAWWRPANRLGTGTAAWPDRFLDFVAEQHRLLAELRDPRGIYAHCLCEVETP